MGAVRAFISFDFDHDEAVKNLLVGQSKNPDTPFAISDWSLKEAIDENWKKKIRERIKAVTVVIVICGEYTHTATGVAAELKMAQEEGIPYFLLWGYGDKNCSKPTTAKDGDKVYKWTWENLKALIGGSR
jgi:hypothetical protein